MENNQSKTAIQKWPTEAQRLIRASLQVLVAHGLSYDCTRPTVFEGDDYQKSALLALHITLQSVLPPLQGQIASVPTAGDATDAQLTAAYTAYDSDGRVSGPEDFAAFCAAVRPLLAGAPLANLVHDKSEGTVAVQGLVTKSSSVYFLAPDHFHYRARIVLPGGTDRHITGDAPTRAKAIAACDAFFALEDSTHA